MNETAIVDHIPFEIELDDFLDKLRIADHPGHAERAIKLARHAEAIARPRGMYGIAYIESKTDDSVVVDGLTLTSRVLRVNLEEAHRVFPFVVTCGRELYDWSRTIDDILERFWADTLMEMACQEAFDALAGHISEHLRPGRTSMMEPGSLEDWPIEQQRPLFQLLGDVREQIGVELTDSCLMVPIKSLSGIRFPTETDFQTCELCPREMCPGRRAPYDPELYGRKYARDNELH